MGFLSILTHYPRAHTTSSSRLAPRAAEARGARHEHMIGGIVQYRSFIWRHARADLRHRYAGTGMGVAWNVIHPLAVITIYSVVFSQIFRGSATTPGAGRLPYTFYLCSGFFPWL